MSINNKRITPEQRKQIITLIDEDIQLSQKQLEIFERNAKRIKRHIQICKDIKTGRANLAYFKRRTKKRKT